MESIELMGKDVLPEFIERDEKAVVEKAKRLEPMIEKVEARSPGTKVPRSTRPTRSGVCPPVAGTTPPMRCPWRWPR